MCVETKNTKNNQNAEVSLKLTGLNNTNKNWQIKVMTECN